jgi:hypothetical protein
MKKQAIERVKELQMLIGALSEDLIHKEVRRDLMGMLLMLEEEVDNINTHTHIVIRKDGTFAMSNGTQLPYDSKIEDGCYCVMLKYNSDTDKIVEADTISVDKYNEIEQLQKEILDGIFGGVRR